MKVHESRGGSRRRRTGAALAAATVAAGLLTLAGPVSSASAAGCYGSGCTGKDPQATGCSADATTIKRVAAPSRDYGYGDLRYSPSCGAYWVKTVSWSTSVPIGGSVYGEVSVNGTWVPLWAENTPGYLAGGSQWSPMIGGYPHYEISVDG